PVPSTERPTMSTAPSSIDFGIPPSGTRVAGVAPGIDTANGSGRSVRVGPPQRRVAVASNAPGTAGGRNRPARLDPVMTEGVPAALLDQWSAGPLAARAGPADTPADTSAEGPAAGTQTGKAGKPTDAPATGRTDPADPIGSSNPANPAN